MTLNTLHMYSTLLSDSVSVRAKGRNAFIHCTSGCKVYIENQMTACFVYCNACSVIVHMRCVL